MTKAGLAKSIEALKMHIAADNPAGMCGVERRGCCWMDHHHETVTPINSSEQLSLRALVAYVSHTTGRAEYRVERDLSDSFCIPNLKCLPSEQYDSAIRYLTEQVTSAFVAKA